MRVRGLAALLAAAVLGGGCGGSSGARSTTAAPAATTASAASSAASTDAADLTPAPQGPSAPDGSPLGDIRCLGSEVLDEHIHMGLAIVLSGQRVTVPANIGILLDAGCLYYLHTHADRGVIHLEAPSSIRTYTLGDFFRVWGYPLGKARLLERTGRVYAWLQGQPYTGDPATIPLRDLETIVLSDAPISGALPTVDFSEIQP